MKLIHDVHLDESLFEAIWEGEQKLVVLVADDIVLAMGVSEPAEKYTAGDGVRLRSLSVTPLVKPSKFFVQEKAGKLPSKRMISATIAEVVHKPALTVMSLTDVTTHDVVAELAPIDIVLRAKPDEVIGYSCPICGNYASPAIYACRRDEAHRAAKDQAQRCCQRVCDDCNAPMAPDDAHYCYCLTCRRKREAEREDERIAKATRVPEAEYDGPVFDPAEGGSQEGYYPSLSELRDNYDDVCETPPPQVWACTITKLELDAERILESALDGHHEDAADYIHDPDDTLQKLLDHWIEECGSSVESYFADYSRLVILDPSKNPSVDEDEDDTDPPEPAGENPTPEAKPDDDIGPETR
jgi:hypothetical protein